MFWFLYDSSGNIQVAQKSSATDWTNLNGYTGALSMAEQRTDLVSWKADTTFNNGDTVLVGGFYYSAQANPQPAQALSTSTTTTSTAPAPYVPVTGATEPTWPAKVNTTVVDNNFTWTCVEQDLSPTAQDAFVNKSHYQVQSVTTPAVTETVTNPDGTTSTITTTPASTSMQLVKTVTDATLLSEAKSKKIAELQAGLTATLASGFTSKQTGHKYVTTTNGEANMHGELTRFSLDSTLQTVMFFTTDAGWIAHTLTQLQQAFLDGGKWKDAQYSQYGNLSSQATNATDMTTLEAIKWTPASY